MKGGKKEMRKILLLIVMVTMFSVGVLYTSNSVEALTVVGGNTSINGSVEEQISLEILPNLLDFGQITPGIAKAGNNITFNATGSNENITIDRKSTRLNSSHSQISYAVFCLKTK